MQQPNAALEILSGWKQIASHLGRGVRTVQRYGCELGLPIRRPAGKSTGSVIATKVELDAWVLASPLRVAFRLPEHSVDSATLLAEFRRNVQETHRLCEELVNLRTETKASLELLQKNLFSAVPQRDQSRENSSRPRLLADVAVCSTHTTVPHTPDRLIDPQCRESSWPR